MDMKILASEIKQGAWEHMLPASAQLYVGLRSEDAIYNQLVAASGMYGDTAKHDNWSDIYLCASWINAMKHMNIQVGSTVCEIGVGLSSHFIRAASSLLGSEGQFVTVTLNKNLIESFIRRTRQLPIRMQFIEGNAMYIDQYLTEKSCAFIGFSHQINDIIQTIAYENAGQRTEDKDWYAVLPDMIKATEAIYKSGNIETVRPEFINIIQACGKVLQTNGLMGFNNFVLEELLDAGHSEQLQHEYIPIARRWISEDIPELEEVCIPGYHTQWWLFFKKVN